MKRYYVCPVKKYTNTFVDSDGDTIIEEFWAAKISEYGSRYSYVSEIPNKSDGAPSHDWAICHIAGDDFTLLDNDSDFILVTENPGLEDEMDTPGRLIREAAKRGVTLTPGRRKKREVVRAFGRKLSTTFDEDRFHINR